MDLPRSIRDAADASAITQLILQERESRDVGRWQDMGACFHPDSRVRISWFRGSGPEFVTASEDMARRKLFAKHRLSPIRVALSGDRAIATCPAVIDIQVRLNGTDMTLSTYARFVYGTERRKGRWGIVSFDAIYMRDELTPAIPGQTVALEETELSAFRPSYRMLSYYLSTQGYRIDGELPGEDRPELVQALMRELYEWAGLALG
jgi:hypothetical protein